MEHDRFQHNNKLYIVGITCLILALAFFFFSLYILPFLIWDLDYDVPAFLVRQLIVLQDKYEFSPATSKLLVWMIYVVPTLITGLISYYISNRIDNQIYKDDIEGAEPEERASSTEVKEQLKESASLGFKIISLMILVVLIILLLQVFVDVTV